MKPIYGEILPFVRKPSQYLGSEMNVIRKDHSLVKAKIALAFPDLYELGMSNLGLRILYHIINQQPDLVAERVFALQQDMERIYREKGYLLGTLESALPLREFDIVGFTLPYELSCTNILNMLELGGIPLEAQRRGNQDPLVIGGGSCSCNPEPLSEFFDLILIGDGEEAILDIVRTYLSAREADLPRSRLLRELARIEGVYVPSFFHFAYNRDGSIKEITPLFPDYTGVTKRIVPELRAEHFPVDPIVPFTEIVHDRIAIEAARGCTRFCRFCQAGIVYRPLRERDPEQIFNLARASLASTGYEELSLLSLNIGDYRFLNETIPCLMEELAPNFTALSLPSLRPGSIDPQILGEIERVRKTGFTLAPEAGSERLRNAINKRISDEALLEDVKEIVSKGWPSIKLYFMIGLPTESKEDLEGLVALCYKVIEHTRPIKGYLKNINISISSFVPKPHTPFQWVGQNQPSELKEKQEFLKNRLRHRKFTVKFHQIEMSFLEAVMSRGDRRLSRVIKEARHLGCCFDGWTETFDFSKWEKAFAQCDLKMDFFAHRPLKKDEVLPWSHINLQVSHEFLWNQYEKALKSEFGGDCFESSCLNCGPCAHRKAKGNPPHLTVPHPKRTQLNPTHPHIGYGAGSDPLLTEERDKDLEKQKSPPPSRARIKVGDEKRKVLRTQLPPKQKIRLEYEKTGEARFLSHLELIKAFWRACRRAGIPLAYSAGFHPHPLLSYSPALAVGIESFREIVDIQLSSYMNPEILLKKLMKELPEGLKPRGGIEIPLHSLSPSDMFVKSTFLMEPGKSETRSFQRLDKAVSHKIDSLMKESFIPFPKAEETPLKDHGNIRPLIEELRLVNDHDGGEGCRILLTLNKANQGKGAKPGQILQLLLQLSDEEILTWRITKIGYSVGDCQHYGIGDNNKR